MDSTAKNADSANTENPWYMAYPAAKTIPSSVTRQELLQWFRDDKRVGHDFVLVDVRRTDFEGGTIRGSLNLPAQSLYPTISALYSLLSQTPVHTVVWYCGSSRGRGTRAAAWFADYLAAQNNTTIRSVILEGGIKGWAASGEEYTSWMDEYDSTVWNK